MTDVQTLVTTVQQRHERDEDKEGYQDGISLLNLQDLLRNTHCNPTQECQNLCNTITVLPNLWSPLQKPDSDST